MLVNNLKDKKKSCQPTTRQSQYSRQMANYSRSNMPLKQWIGEVQPLLSLERIALLSPSKRTLLQSSRILAQFVRFKESTNTWWSLSLACRLMPEFWLTKHALRLNHSASTMKTHPPSNMLLASWQKPNRNSRRRVESDLSVFLHSLLVSKMAVQNFIWLSHLVLWVNGGPTQLERNQKSFVSSWKKSTTMDWTKPLLLA